MGRKFRNDYCELAHPRIIKALERYASEQNEAYGLDYHSEQAAKYIKNIFGAPNSDVHFISGGTLTNLLMISYILRHFEGVISPDTGHINVHETAAVEGSGYKIIAIPNINGKITADQIRKTVESFGNNEHMVKPGMVYISNSTEIGTIYNKKELEEIYKTCKDLGLYFFIDGARLGSALTSKDNDVEPSLLGSLCDAFYIGGTKNGLMLGEALVLNSDDLKANFRFHIKNKGAMLAKGYAVGIQFEEAFKDGLYFELARKSNECAEMLKRGLIELGVDILPSPTNQIFATFDKKEANQYIEKFGCELWSEENDKTTIRFVTSFLTAKEDVEDLLNYIKKNRK